MSTIGASPASADQTITHTFKNVDCEATFLGTTLHQKQDISVGLVTPTSVTANTPFTVTFSGGSSLLPSTGAGLAIDSYDHLSLTYQIVGTTFDAGTIHILGPATLTPTAPPSTPQTVTETSTLTAADKITNGNPGPFPPGTLTTPDISVQATAPASGNVTLNAFQLTTNLTLHGGITVKVTCAIPTTTLVTIPVTAVGATTTTGPSTTVGPTTTTMPGTTTTAGPTTTAAPTTTVPVSVAGGVASGSGTNVNTCKTHVTPPQFDAVVPDGTTDVTITIATQASPAPHFGQPITLKNSTVTISVPPDLLLKGYAAGVLHNGSVIPATLALTVAGSNTTEGTRAYPLIHSSPKVVIHDPDGIPGDADDSADPLSVTTALASTLWHPTSNTADVIFTEKSAVITAAVVLGTTTITDTLTCDPAVPTNSFIAVGATGSVTTTTNVVVAAATPTTVAPAGTLPFTGSANVALWVVIGAICIDGGIVLIMGAKRRATHLFHHN